MNEWELLKENVEPIKSGRSIKTLKSALNEKPIEVEARELKRKEFESELRTYSGSDLLSVYYDYIVWVEQNYPLGGNEGNLKTLLQNCIEQFHTTEQYQNDDRLLKVFLKFIKYIKDSPLELFTFFHSSGFATKLAEFYINWSFHLENHKNCRKAAEVLREGIAKKAEPSAALKRSLEELEVRVAKAVANQQMEELNDNESEEQQRQALNNLKTKTRGGKTVAPVNRIGKAIKDRATGLKASKPAANSGQTKTKTPAIYCDENDPTVATKPTAQPVVTRSVKAVSTVGQENEQKPGKWSENALPAQKPVATESQPKFSIHADDSDDESPEPVRKPTESNTLKIRARNADSPPIARFEKPDPSKKFAFNMKKVYAGGEEFSFEEIRGRRWLARKKKEEEALRNKKLEEEVAQLRIKKEEDALRSQKLEEELAQLRQQVEAVDELRRQVELLSSHLNAQSSQQSSQPIQEIVVHKNEIKGSDRPKSASPVMSSAESSAAKSGSNTTNNNNQTNVTANGTKAAYSLVRDLWDGTLANQTRDICQENNAKFDINAVIDKTEEQVQKKEAFAIFSDTTLMSKPEDRAHKPRESVGFNDCTIALPKTEMTFIGNAHCASTPVADKSKKSEPSYNFNAIQSLNNNYNFVGGMTAKLSPIVETSREYNSKSSSSGTSSSGTMSSTGGQALSRRQRALSGVENIDPFDVCLLSQLLDSLSEPIDTRKGFFRANKSLPKIKQSETRLNLGPDVYQLNKLIATGAYAQVFTAQIDANTDDENDSCGYNMFMAQKWYALKIARNANEWEFYICDELQKRLSRSKSLPDIELSVMVANPTVMFKDACVLVDEFAPDGTLMDVINNCRAQTTSFPNSLIAFFALELIQIVRQIHRQHIIHADLKPDNILVLNFPSKEEINNVLKRTSSIKVIDFGRSIDMSLFPDGTTFNVTVNTKGSQCCEMLDSKPWTFQTDWFGVLDCIHVMLFGDYIKVHKNKDNKWEINEKFRRYHLTDIWRPLFDTLLNIEDCYLINGVLEPFVKQLDDYIRVNVNDLVRDAVRIEKLNDSALKKRK